MGAIRRFTIPFLFFAFERGLDLSGWENIWIAASIWATGGALGIWALVTWQPAQRTFRKAVQLRITIPEPSSPDISENVVIENENSNKGLFDFQAEAYEAISIITKVYVQISKDTEKYAVRLAKYVTRFAKDQSPEQKVRLAEKLAKEIKGYTDKMGIHGLKLEINAAQLSESSLAWFRDERTLAMEGYQTFVSLNQTIEEFRSSTKGLRNSVISAQQSLNSMKGYSQELNRSLDGLISVFDVNVAAIQDIETFCGDANEAITNLLGGE